jgi:acyl-CoA thioester hydrolase
MKENAARRLPGYYAWTLAMEPRFSDMDPNRHLNNVAVMGFFEEARVRFNRHIVETTPGLVRPRYLVAHASVDYLAEGRYPDSVTMGYAIGNIGRTSIRAQKALFQGSDCIALCDTVLVHRGETGPAPLPDELRSRLEAFAPRV